MKQGGFVLRGWHVLFAMLVFFGVVIAVNTVFITAATRSFPGLTVEEPFKRGLAKDFNQTLADRDEQAARGWRAAVEHVWDGETRTARVRVVITNAQGQPVNGLTVEGDLQRVVTDAGDRAVRFAALGGGAYSVRIEDVDPGDWRLTVRSAFADGVPFKAEKRLWMG